MFFRKDKNNLSRKSGFTLIELMVVLVVFVALTGIMISSQSKFDGTILLNNLAYDIALSIREAQTYGVNVKEFSGFGLKIFWIRNSF
jgi:prepilin-type N-terminal cleavage/methylation domain-containing protein